MEIEIIKEIKKFVEEECKKPSSKYGFEPFEFHFIPVVKYCRLLAESKNLNDEEKEICILSGWLHDIGSIIYGRENHHITSSEIAESKLRGLGYSENKIERVKSAVYTHRGSQKMIPKFIEGKILQEADSMDSFDNLPGLFKAAFIYENLNQKQACSSILNKLERKFSQLSEEGKKFVEEKFKAIKFILINHLEKE